MTGEDVYNVRDPLWTIVDVNRGVSERKRWKRRRYGRLSLLEVCRATEASGPPATNVLVGDDQPTRELRNYFR